MSKDQLGDTPEYARRPLSEILRGTMEAGNADKRAKKERDSLRSRASRAKESLQEKLEQAIENRREAKEASRKAKEQARKAKAKKAAVRKSNNGLNTESLEAKINKSKTTEDLRKAVQHANRSFSAAERDFTKKEAINNKIVEDVKKFNDAKEQIAASVRQAYLSDKYPSGIDSSKVTLREMEAVEKEISKRVKQETQKFTEGINDIEGRGFLSSAASKLSDKYKSLGDAKSRLDGLKDTLERITVQQHDLAGLHKDTLKEMNHIQREMGYNGLSGWFRKQKDKVIGSPTAKRAIERLEELKQDEKKIKDNLKEGAKDFDRSMKDYAKASKTYDKVSERSNDKAKKFAQSFDKYINPVPTQGASLSSLSIVEDFSRIKEQKTQSITQASPEPGLSEKTDRIQRIREMGAEEIKDLAAKLQEEEKTAAATKIQAAFRGSQARDPKGKEGKVADWLTRRTEVTRGGQGAGTPAAPAPGRGGREQGESKQR